MLSLSPKHTLHLLYHISAENATYILLKMGTVHGKGTVGAMKKQGFLQGSAVLMASALIVKVMGAMFRIPLANMLGGTGMGYFSAAYSIFMPVYAVSATGLPAAVSGCTAAYAAMGRDESENIRRTALRLFGAVGVCACLVIMLGAYPFCKYISEDMRALPAVAAIAPSVIAGCLVSVYRGYYEGMRNMYPTAVSQTVEGAAKLVLGLSLCGMCLWAAREYPNSFLRIIGWKRGDAESAAVPYAAAAAVLGITLSSWAGLIYIAAADRKMRGASHKNRGTSVGTGRILSDLLKIALPGAVGALVTNLSSLIDLVTIMRSLGKLAESSPGYFSELIRAGVSAENIPAFVYGSFTGLAVTLFNLVPSVTNMFGKSMLPAAAAAKAGGDRARLGECSEQVLFVCALVSVPAGAGMAAMAEPVLQTLFYGRELEIIVCRQAAALLGLSVPLVCISSSAFAVLQAAGRADIPVKLMGIGAVLKLVGNLLLVPVPGLGVSGAALSTLLCYVFICAASVIMLRKHACLDEGRFISMLLRIISCGICCAAGAVFMKEFIGGAVEMRIATLISCGFGGVVYVCFGALQGVFDRKKLQKLLK